MKDSYLDKGRTNQKLETRNKILDSAAYFMGKGLEFNLEDIAKKTGISRATIYRYFSNTEILMAEVGLHVNTESAESIVERIADKSFEEKVLKIQDYYNTLTLDNENLFRRYLSTVIDTSNSGQKRGARRKKTLELALESSELKLEEKEKLSNLLTLLMGMEPFIVAKDVCGLNNEESLDLLQWGMKLILNSFNIEKTQSTTA